MSSSESHVVYSPLASEEEYPPRGTGRRKGHRKSRGGCFSCKIRKIKCQETRPSCGNCIRTKLHCVYPARISNRPHNVPAPVVPQPARQPCANPAFTLTDLRALHHFIIEAHPHLPMGAEKAWIQEIPAYIHHFEFLAHAVLALGASHLDYIRVPGFAGDAEKHRLLAIQGLNDVFQNDDRTAAEGDAMLAACYALTFVAAYNGEGLGNFFTLVRGCGSATVHVRRSRKKSIMITEDPQHDEIMMPRLVNLPTINTTLAKKALESLMNVRPHCKVEVEKTLLERMIQSVALLETSPPAAYLTWIHTYDIITTMSHGAFTDFTSRTNAVAQILQCHFIAIEALLSPILTREILNVRVDSPGRDSLTCARRSADFSLPLVAELTRWPLEFCGFIVRHRSISDVIRTICAPDPPVEELDAAGVPSLEDYHSGIASCASMSLGPGHTSTGYPSSSPSADMSSATMSTLNLPMLPTQTGQLTPSTSNENKSISSGEDVATLMQELDDIARTDSDIWGSAGLSHNNEILSNSDGDIAARMDFSSSPEAAASMG